MVCKTSRLSLLEVMEGIGQHNAGRQGGCETSEDEEEVNAGGSGEAEEAGANGEGCWLSMASIMAEEAAVSQVSIPSLPNAVSFFVFGLTDECANT